MNENTGPDLVVAGLALGRLDHRLLASPARGPLLFDRELDRLQATNTQLVTGRKNRLGDPVLLHGLDHLRLAFRS